MRGESECATGRPRSATCCIRRFLYSRAVGEPFPLPPPSGGVTAVAAPAPGAQNWAGAPSAALDDDGSVVVAYRMRWADGPRDANVIARSDDGERFTTVAT